MKVMNEIESEIDAEIVEILVKNGQPVEYGELLFRLRPS
jgi:acetyl-CoA carboxylase biotin carboxyl carrier protein